VVPFDATRRWIAAAAATLRSTVMTTTVVLVSVLATYGTALAVERAAHLGVALVIQAVVLAVTVSRVERRRAERAERAGRRRLPAAARLLTLPALAVVANEVGTLMLRHPNVGDALFVVGVSGAIWIRRFGPAATRVGTLATLPFIALLIVPAAAAPGGPSRWWSALMAVIASFWVITLHGVAAWLGLLGPADERRAEATADAGTVVPASAAPAAPDGGGAVDRWRLTWKPASSTKMAAQMAVGLAAAFAVGRWAFPDHWPWLVVTAYIVAAGNRGRGDVAVKSVSRLAGGALGTVVATAAVDAVPARSTWTVVAIFIALAVAVALRNVHYAFWAAGVTSMLALLYGYFGLTSGHVLAERLEAIAVGSVLAVAASWLVLPVRTRDVARLRIARASAALTDVLLAVARAETVKLPQGREAFAGSADELGIVAETLAARRLLYKALRRPGPHLADAADAVQRCRRPVEALVAAADAAPSALASGANRRRAGGLARQLGSVRRAIGGRPEPAGDLPSQRAAAGQDTPPPADSVEAALGELAGAVGALRAVFPAISASPPADAPAAPVATGPRPAGEPRSADEPRSSGNAPGVEASAPAEQGPATNPAGLVGPGQGGR